MVGTRRDFFVACPNALTASPSCRVTDRWFTPRFSVYAEFAVRKWTAQVPGPEPIHPIWPACWIDTPDRSSSSTTGIVQDAWDIYGEELEVVPHELVHRLRVAYDRSSVDDFRFAWSTVAEESLFRAYCSAGGPDNPQMYLERGKLRVRIRRLGGQSAGGS